MGEKILPLATIDEIVKRNFFVPDYQRGYRWSEQQVEDLLNDITNFIPSQIENSNEKTWYCLQPLVVKVCDETKKIKHKLDALKTWYEVIDGQQRLTTIFLIGHYINERWRGSDKDDEVQLKYETREGSTDFLSDLKVNSSNDVDIDDSNIDYFHISTAYKTIHNWVKDKKNAKFIKDNFIDKFINNTKTIWYEANEKDTIKIFTRINSGKIPLTNAELIKALFLNSSNFSESDVDLKQLQIANEWDRIEYELQDEAFWYFINEKENTLDTRIEFIFNQMAGKTPGNEYDFFTFDFFCKKFITNSKEEITKNWNEIKRYFQTLEEWFTDRELYHKIGFLISNGEEIKSIIDLSKGCTKIEFKDKLHSLIAAKVDVQIDKLEYSKSEVKRVLLLHNIQTILDNKSETSRFPFDRFKKYSWDVEHIHAIATRVKVKPEDQATWLINNFEKTDKHNIDEFNSKIEIIKRDNNPITDDDFQLIIEYILGDEDNSIRNLCLLDSGTNRSYKNDSFKNKRKKIIENEKKGTFITFCTRNVFMKYYSKESINLDLWNENDRADYIEDIKRVLTNSKYLPIQN